MELALETVWPADLPLPKVDYTGLPRNTTLVSKRDSAYITRRSRFECTYAMLSVSWCLTNDQLEDFETFFTGELDNGIAQFKIELRYPENSALKEWAVRFDEGYSTTYEDGTWLVQASLDLVGPIQIPVVVGLPTYEDFESYDDDVDVHGLTGGEGWIGSWRVLDNPFGIKSEEDFESYGDDVDLEGLDDGDGWGGAWSVQ